MSNVADISPYLEPIRRSITLKCGVDEAFRAFTDDLASWWPLATHSLGKERAHTCLFEPRAGGRVLEVRDDGEETVWAEIVAWEPSHRLLLRWHPGLPPEEAQEVEIWFHAEGGGSRIELEHRDWQASEVSRTRRAQYNEGWAGVLDLFGSWEHWAPCLSRERRKEGKAQ